MDTLQAFGIGLIQFLQLLSPMLDSVMNLFTFLGKIEFYLLIIPLIYWAFDNRLGIRVLFVLITIDILGSTFKLLFHQPRPYWVGQVKALAEETSYGIPSTHASDSLAVWGYLVYRLKKTWVWIVSVALIILIGLSRLYLGVHFPHDVVFGWLLGAVLLWVFAKCENPVADWAKQQGAWKTIGVSFAMSLAVILVGALIQAWLSGIPDPAEWSALATQARTPSYSFTLAGALFGAISGYELMKLYAPFKSNGQRVQKIGRYGLGIVGVLVIYFGLDVLFGLIAADETTLGYALRYLRYAIVTFWVTFLAPWVFLRIRLADRQI
jgi:membrane-associated phospholipid phosphatase